MRRTLLVSLSLSLASACAGPSNSQASDASTGTATGTSTTAGTSTGTSDTTGDDAASSSDEESADTGGGFPPDGGGATCGEACDIWDQSACPEGEKCTGIRCGLDAPWFDETICREIEGDGQHGEECEFTMGNPWWGHDTCAPGNQCWFPTNLSPMGTCVAICAGSPDAPECPAGYECEIRIGSALPLCLAPCDPLAPECPGLNEICADANLYPKRFICTPDYSDGGGLYGAPCQGETDCGAGHSCVGAGAVPELGCEDAACCSPYCDLNAPSPCSGVGQECIAIDYPAEEYEHVGICKVVQP